MNSPPASYPSLADNPARLKLETYPIQFELPLRWSDVVDGLRIGPIGLARYYEDARMDMVEVMVGKGPLHDGTWRSFVRHCTIETLTEINFPEPLTVACGILRIGNTSYQSGFALFQGGVCVSLSDATMVWVGADGRPNAAGEDMKAILRKEMLRS